MDVTSHRFRRNDYADLSIGRRYLGSVYWALTTLTTVGYGDLSARTVEEQVRTDELKAKRAVGTDDSASKRAVGTDES